MSLLPHKFRCIQCHEACDPEDHICKEITKRDKMVGRPVDTWELIERVLGLESDLYTMKFKLRETYREGIIRAILAYGPSGVKRENAEAMADHYFMKEYDEQGKGRPTGN